MRTRYIAALIIVAMLVGSALGALLVTTQRTAHVRVSTVSSLSVTDPVTGQPVAVLEFGTVTPPQQMDIGILVTWTTNEPVTATFYLSVTQTGLNLLYFTFRSPQHGAIITPNTSLSVSLNLDTHSTAPAGDVSFTVVFGVSDTPL